MASRTKMASHRFQNIVYPWSNDANQQYAYHLTKVVWLLSEKDACVKRNRLVTRRSHHGGNGFQTTISQNERLTSSLVPQKWYHSKARRRIVNKAGCCVFVARLRWENVREVRGRTHHFLGAADFWDPLKKASIQFQILFFAQLLSNRVLCAHKTKHKDKKIKQTSLLPPTVYQYCVLRTHRHFWSPWGRCRRCLVETPSWL